MTSEIFLLKSLLKYFKKLRRFIRTIKVEGTFRDLLITVIKCCGIINKLLCKYNVAGSVYLVIDKKLNRKIMNLKRGSDLRENLEICYKTERVILRRIIESVDHDLKRLEHGRKNNV